jgi:hypothetical protein
VTTSADWPRRRLTGALISAFAEPLFEPLRQQFATWLDEGESLCDFRDDLVHSVGAIRDSRRDIYAEQQSRWKKLWAGSRPIGGSR